MKVTWSPTDGVTFNTPEMFIFIEASNIQLRANTYRLSERHMVN